MNIWMLNRYVISCDLPGRAVEKLGVSSHAHPNKGTLVMSNIQHNREIRKSGYPLRKAMVEMQNTGFEIKKTYRVFEHPYHRSYVLEEA